jgi:cation transporter-like permease
VDKQSETEERERILKTEGGDSNNVATFRGSRKVHSSIHLKVIKNDVFRQPTFPRVYSILFGLGLQLSIALLATSLSVVLFFKSEANRATILVILMTFYLCSGIILGFASSKMYMTINVCL